MFFFKEFLQPFQVLHFFLNEIFPNIVMSKIFCNVYFFIVTVFFPEYQFFGIAVSESSEINLVVKTNPVVGKPDVLSDQLVGVLLKNPPGNVPPCGLNVAFVYIVNAVQFVSFNFRKLRQNEGEKQQNRDENPKDKGGLVVAFIHKMGKCFFVKLSLLTRFI